MLNLLYLAIAITFETCGDAYIRIALRGHKPPAFVLGVALLAIYGTVVSFPSWGFSRTMGVYIAVFFIISQIVARVIMHETIRLPTLVGGLLIVSGGVIILCWSPAKEDGPGIEPVVPVATVDPPSAS